MLPDSKRWNALIGKTIPEIRKIDPTRLILVGSNHNNAASELKNLDVFPDKNILYTFHNYLPLSVTHQKAPWIPVLVEYNHTINYPGEKADGLEKFMHGSDHIFRDEIEVTFNREYARKNILPAVEFCGEINQPVYCGGFGIYEAAPMSTRLNWTRDVVELLNEYHIGRAIWTYKGLGFGLVDNDGRVVNEELVKIAIMRQ